METSPASAPLTFSAPRSQARTVGICSVILLVFAVCSLIVILFLGKFTSHGWVPLLSLLFAFMVFDFFYPKSGTLTLTDIDVVFTNRGQSTRIAYKDVAKLEYRGVSGWRLHTPTDSLDIAFDPVVDAKVVALLRKRAAALDPPSIRLPLRGPLDKRFLVELIIGTGVIVAILGEGLTLKLVVGIGMLVAAIYACFVVPIRYDFLEDRLRCRFLLRAKDFLWSSLQGVRSLQPSQGGASVAKLELRFADRTIFIWQDQCPVLIEQMDKLITEQQSRASAGS